jgi:hypothetical protein
MTTPVYSRGQIVWAQPPKLNEDGLPVTKTKGGRITKHPIVVLSVKAGTPDDTLTGVMVTSFNHATSIITAVEDVSLHKWFLPVSPAEKESIHDPIPGTGLNSNPDEPSCQWVVLVDKLPLASSSVVRS